MKRARKDAPNGAPAKDAAAQLKRVLALIPRIADGDEHSLKRVAALVDVDHATVIRDLESIAQRFGDPGGFVEGLQIMIEATRVSVHTDHFRRPMRLTVPELHALDLGLAMLHAERTPGEQRAIEGARVRIRKLVAKLERDPLPESGYYATTAASGAHLPPIRQGLSKHTKLRILYKRGDSEETSQRTVCPYRLVFASGTWYLVAYCDRAEAIRVFRIDRIESLEVLGDTYDMPEESAIAEHVNGGRAFLTGAQDMLRVRYSPKVARWIQERERGTTEPDGSFVVEHPLADADWAVRHVLQYGVQAEILSPPSAREAMRRRLDAMLE